MNDIRRLFVTGASTGLGYGLANHYVRPGAHLGLVARRESLLREHEKAWTARGARVEVYAGDVADTDLHDQERRGVRRGGGRRRPSVRECRRRGSPTACSRAEAREIAWLMNENVVGVTTRSSRFVPQMVKQGSGVLCAVSSMAGHQPLPAAPPTRPRRRA
jgi:short-subunit dehydrogenase